MGASNAELDEPFTLWDLEWALEQIKRKSAPGEDQITYTLILNLSDKDKEHLLDIKTPTVKKALSRHLGSSPL
ncbi:hypothetical protein HPB48_014922 [Haemaphysalis longicornis]|uniref:Uncharacterized protein n=1 Tax=Haemaphysalis longicornis TaxID=44386 RepID=A0A9J6FGS4_HAELO|nr:hypothetical protein HPB48_014922 [Haemaphysalis longicornis]